MMAVYILFSYFPSEKLDGKTKRQGKEVFSFFRFTLEDMALADTNTSK